MRGLDYKYHIIANINYVSVVYTTDYESVPAKRLVTTRPTNPSIESSCESDRELNKNCVKLQVQ